MSAALLVAAMLDHPSVIAAVGARRAMSRLPQGTAMPALVYRVSSTPVQPINAAAGAQLTRSRISTISLGRTPAEVESVAASVRDAIDMRSGVINARRVVSVVREFSTDIDYDDDAGVWSATTDYIAHWYD